ncbi:MAG: asparagine synthetase B family protein [Gemmatimonas sp.]
MSVVLGFASVSSDRENAEWLRASTHAMSYAGPDAQHTWCSPAQGRGHSSANTITAGLGHALLYDALDDASTQPLTFDDAVRISADVRLDDREELQRQLRSAGQMPKAGCDDASLVLHAYLAWGTACTSRLAGDFAFVVWDGRNGTMFCARDQMGTVPLFYVQNGAQLQVSNALHALQLDARVSDSLRDESVGDFLLFGFQYDTTRTMFADIMQLAPAHSLEWKAGRVTIRRYWSEPRWEGFFPFRKPAEYAEQFLGTLQLAVADRMRVPGVGLQLSGGLDSTTVAAVAARVSAARERGVELRGYSGTMHRIAADRELEHAERVAQHLRIPIELIDLADMPDIDPLDRSGHVLPEPNFFRRTEAEDAFVRRPVLHSRTVLTGLGGDTLLAYTPTFWMDWLRQGDVRRVVSAVQSHWRVFGRPPVPGLRSALRFAAFRRSSPVDVVPPWIHPEFAQRLHLRERLHDVLQRMKRAHHSGGLSSWPYWSSLLSAGHPAYTGTPVRFRHPLFDLRLQKLVLSVPPRPWLIDKYLMREAARDLLPESVRVRPKTPMVQSASNALQTSRGELQGLSALIHQPSVLADYVQQDALARAAHDDGGLAPRLRRPLGFALGFSHWLHRRWPSTAVAPGIDALASNDARVVAVP